MPDLERNRLLAAALARDGRKQYLIAADAGIHPVTLSAIVHGRAAATERARAGLARALNRSENELFEEVPA